MTPLSEASEPRLRHPDRSEGSRDYLLLRDVQSYEGTSISKEDLRQMQDHPPQRRGARDLRQHETQTAPGIEPVKGHDFSRAVQALPRFRGFSR